MGLLQNTAKPKKTADKKLQPLKDIEEYPIPVYQFAIEIKGSGDTAVIVALFQGVTGISVKREAIGLTEGGLNNYTYEFPGHVSYEHITFDAGLTSSSFFWDWMMEGQFDGRARAMDFTLVQRRPNPDYSGAAGEPIFKEIKRWDFTNAYPVNWKLSDLSLDDSEKIVIESLELSFDYFEPGQIP
jgi:phage tail-like protein